MGDKATKKDNIVDLAEVRAKRAGAPLPPPVGFFARNPYYILDGRKPKRVPLLRWAAWYETANKTIAITEVGNVVVSTIFLGLDHSFGRGPPVLFETMVFGGTLDGGMNRYTSYDRAEIGHAAMVLSVERASLR